MSINKFSKDIADFNEKFGVQQRTFGFFDLTDEEATFALKALREEVQEYETALLEEDTEGQFDALIDLVYFAMGRAAIHSFPFDQGWNRVHQANMAKERATCASQSKRGSALDIIKPEGWKPPYLEDLLTFPRNEEMVVPRVFIVEGPDACGKTSLARALAKRFDAVYIHMTATETLIPAMADYTANMIENAKVNLAQGRSVVFDRAWISELCYGGVFRGTVFADVADQAKAFNELKPTTIFCMDPNCAEVAADRHEEHLDEVHPYSREDYLKVYAEYENLMDYHSTSTQGPWCTAVKWFDDYLTAEQSADEFLQNI